MGAAEDQHDRSASSGDSGPRGIRFERAAATARIREAACLNATDRVLDVCCGAGGVAFALAPDCAYVTGIDFVDSLLASAEAHAIEHGLANVSLQQDDVANMPFDDASFDCVISQLALHHLTDPERVMGEMVRVLKSPGRLIVVDIVAPQNPDRRDAQNRLERLRDPAHVGFLAVEQIMSLIEMSGLETVQRERWDVARDADEWLAAERVPEEVRANAAAREKVKSAMRKAARAKSTDWKITIDGSRTRFRQQWMIAVAEKFA